MHGRRPGSSVRGPRESTVLTTTACIPGISTVQQNFHQILPTTASGLESGGAACERCSRQGDQDGSRPTSGSSFPRRLTRPMSGCGVQQRHDQPNDRRDDQNPQQQADDGNVGTTICASVALTRAALGVLWNGEAVGLIAAIRMRRYEERRGRCWQSVRPDYSMGWVGEWSTGRSCCSQTDGYAASSPAVGWKSPRRGHGRARRRDPASGLVDCHMDLGFKRQARHRREHERQRRGNGSRGRAEAGRTEYVGPPPSVLCRW